MKIIGLRLIQMVGRIVPTLWEHPELTYFETATPKDLGTDVETVNVLG